MQQQSLFFRPRRSLDDIHCPLRETPQDSALWIGENMGPVYGKYSLNISHVISHSEILYTLTMFMESLSNLLLTSMFLK